MKFKKNQFVRFLAAATFTISVAVSPGANLYWDGNDTSANADGGAGTWSAGTATNWDDAATGGNSVAWAEGSAASFGGTAGTVTVSGTVAPTSITLNTTGYSITGGTLSVATAALQVDTAGNNATIASAITGTNGLVKAGAGTLTLSGGKAYTGGTTVNAGTLSLATGSAAGTVGGLLTINSGATVTTTAGDALGYNAGVQVTTLAINGGTFNNASAGNEGYRTNISLTGGTVSSTGTGPFNFTTGFGITSTASSAVSTFSSPILIRDANNVPVSVATGTTPGGVDLLISGVISEGNGVGAITKSGTGVLSLSAANAFSGTTTVSGGSLLLSNPLALQNSTLSSGGVVFDSSVATHAFTVGGLSGAGAITLADNAGTPNPVALTAGKNNATTTYTGVLSGAGSLVKTGTGTLILTGLNTLAGGTTVNQGTLQLGNAVATDYGATGLLTGSLTANSGTTVLLQGSNAFGYTSKINSVTLNGATLTHAGNGDNGWGVAYTLNGATMRVTGAGRFSFGNSTSVTTVASPTTSLIAGQVAMREGNPGNTVPFVVADGDATTDLLVSANVVVSAANVGITKSGPGTMMMTGANTYSGATTINGGVFTLGKTGTLAASPVVVGSTGVFRTESSGKTLTALTANSGAILSPAAQAGDTTTVTNALTLTDGAVIAVAPVLDGAVTTGTYDLYTAGSITGTGTPVLDYSSLYGATRVTGSVAVNGNKLQLTLTGLGANLVWTNSSAAGAATGTWDGTALNFLNGASPDVFKAFDSVLFDDTVASGLAKTVNLTGSLAPARITVNNSTGNYTFASTGLLTGGGSLLKQGSSTLTIGSTANWSLSGDITVSGGTVDFSAKAITPAKVTLSGGALNNATVSASTLDLQSGSATALFTGPSVWTKTTAGTVTLNAANTITAAGTVSAGTLNIGTAGTLGSGSVSIASGATVAFNRAATAATVSNGFAGSGTLTFTGTNDGTATNASEFILGGNSSAFTGNATVAGARLNFTGANTWGTGTITATAAGSGLYLGAATYNNPFVIAGTGWREAGGNFGAMRLAGSTVAGTVTLAGDTRITTVLSSGTISGAIQETGGPRALELGATGAASTITLTGNSTYTGATTISASTVTLNGSLGATAVNVGTGSALGGIGSIGSGGSLTFATGATSLNVNPLQGALTVNGNVTLGGTTTVNLAVPASGTIPILNYTGAISGSATNLALANAASYRNAVFNVGAHAITLDLGGKNLIWNGSSGGQWLIGGAAPHWNTTGSGESDVYFQGDSVTFDDTGSATNVTLSVQVQPAALVVNSNTVNYTFTESATGYISGNTSLVKSGSSTLTLTGGANTHTGGTVVNGGTIIASGTNSATGCFGGGDVTINSGGTLSISTDNSLMGYAITPKTIRIHAGGTLTSTGGASCHVPNLILDGGTFSAATPNTQYANWNLDYPVSTPGGGSTSTISGGNVSLTQTGGTRFNVGGGDTLNVSTTIAHVTGSADLGLVKQGTGKLTLAAANSYTSATTLSAGTLLVTNATGSATGTGAVTAAAGTTLTGTGIITGPVATAGILAPGDGAPGILTTGTAVLNGTLATEIDGANADKLVVNGDLTLTGATLSVSVLGGGFSGPYVIASYTGNLTGTFASVPFGYTVTYDTGAKQITLAQSPGFASWAAANGLTAANNGLLQDPDHDGISNLMEYVLMGDPLAHPATDLTVQVLDSDMLHFYFQRSNRSKLDTNVAVQWTSDLGSWTDIPIPDADPADGVVAIDGSNADYDVVTVNIPRSNAVGGKLFVRIKATPKP